MTKELDLSEVRIYSGIRDDAKDAMDLIGQEVYMANDENFSDYTKGELLAVRYGKDSTIVKYPFLCGFERYTHYMYIILCKDAKFKEKELRPFKSVQEFIKEIECKIGDVITFKRKDLDAEYTMIFNGYVLVKGDALVVYLGAACYTLEELMDYLYYKGGEWHPFGIIE